MSGPTNKAEKGRSLQDISLQDTAMQAEDREVLEADITVEKDVVKENINFVTPYAFAINEKLYGLPLAKPRQRLIALLIDGVLISMLTLVSYVVLFGLYAGLFLNAARHFKSKDKNPLIRKLLRGGGVFCFVIFAIGSINYFFDDSADTETLVKEKGVKEQDVKETAEMKIVEAAEKTDSIKKTDSIEKAGPEETTHSSERERSESASSESDSTESDKQEPVPDISNGFWPWVEGVLKQFGVSFGWAAFYFSIFVGWFSGQTPGKHLMGIKVIKLDGEDLNLWEAFGRYGGYAAGFATGLIGFLLVYWDPNRQAIQDKISGTLVIDIKGERLN